MWKSGRKKEDYHSESLILFFFFFFIFFFRSGDDLDQIQSAVKDVSALGGGIVVLR